MKHLFRLLLLIVTFCLSVNLCAQKVLEGDVIGLRDSPMYEISDLPVSMKDKPYRMPSLSPRVKLYDSSCLEFVISKVRSLYNFILFMTRTIRSCWLG